VTCESMSLTALGEPLWIGLNSALPPNGYLQNCSRSQSHFHPDDDAALETAIFLGREQHADFATIAADFATIAHDSDGLAQRKVLIATDVALKLVRKL
jgi:hypothetical protein